MSSSLPLAALTATTPITANDVTALFAAMMSGETTPEETKQILLGLRDHHETPEAIAAAASVLRTHMKSLPVTDALRPDLVDCCGTGGDKKGSYNVSTAVAILLAACDVPMVKHGNKAVSSKSGSADILTALGVNIHSDEATTLRCLEQAGICFLLAPRYHSAMKHVAPIRAELGIRTIFNVLGPLINPARPTRQIMGVFAKEWVDPIARVLQLLGTQHAWVVHGLDGMDELSVCADSYVAEVRGDTIRSFTLSPGDCGLDLHSEEALRGGDAAYNAQALHALLAGQERDCLHAFRDITLLNAAAGLIVAGRCDRIEEGLTIATNALDNGAALATLNQWKTLSGAIT